MTTRFTLVNVLFWCLDTKNQFRNSVWNVSFPLVHPPAPSIWVCCSGPPGGGGSQASLHPERLRGPAGVWPPPRRRGQEHPLVSPRYQNYMSAEVLIYILLKSSASSVFQVSWKHTFNPPGRESPVMLVALVLVQPIYKW